MSETVQLVRPETGSDPYWDDGWRLSLEATPLRGVLWCRAGLIEAHRRAVSSRRVAFQQWSAAVEAVWWAVALDEALYALHAIHDSRYTRARASDCEGAVVVGLRWLRHQHAHRIVVTGHGGPKRDFLGDGGPPFYISPSNRWMDRSEIPNEGRAADRRGEQAYDNHVAGSPLEGPVAVAISWFDAVLLASRIDPWQEITGDDATVL